MAKERTERILPSNAETLTGPDSDEDVQSMETTKPARKRPKDIAPEEFERRMIPATPDQLIGALHDKVHFDLGPKRRVPPERIKKRQGN